MEAHWDTGIFLSIRFQTTEKMILIGLDILPDAKLVHSFLKVWIDKEVLTMKIAVQELCRRCGKQTREGKEIEIARKKEEGAKTEPEKKGKVEFSEIRVSPSGSGSGVKRRAEGQPANPDWNNLKY